MHRDVAPVGPYYALTNKQAQTDPFVIVFGRPLQLSKFLEKVWYLLSGDSLSTVNDIDLQHLSYLIVSYVDSHSASIGEL